MSLDVYLSMKGAVATGSGSGIFVREDGETKEITRAEWEEKFPGREPYITKGSEEDEVYSANITHNLGQMADDAGIYDCLWRPDEHGMNRARDIIEPLRAGLALLKSDRARFEKFNPENGWGNYDGLVRFAEKYLAACEEYPDAEISVSR